MRVSKLPSRMLTAANYTELEDKGYTVVPNVLMPQDCDTHIDQFNKWVNDFDKWPKSRKGIIHGHSSGHLQPTWQVRLAAKNVFSQIWKTDKLLTSFDSIAIGRPPENGEEPFDDGSSHWLHLDQESTKEGLHAYQGALYLEEACVDDWTLLVMEKSHKVFKSFFVNHEKAAKKSAENNFYRLNKTDVRYFEKQGCKIVRVPVPKGGIVLWDSRLIHANAQPIKGRKNPGRWRYVVFVSMTPANWASDEDLEVKQNAYASCQTTNHWSSAGSTLTKATLGGKVAKHMTLPEAAKTPEAQLLAGVSLYDFGDGKPNGSPKPLGLDSKKRKADNMSD